MTTLSLKERQWQVREDAILDAAHELLEAQGYTDMSMDDVAARVGISKATLYHHFGSKEDLAARVITRAMQRGRAEMTGGEPAERALARLERALKRSIRRKAMMWSNRAALPPSVTRHPLYCEQQAEMTRVMSDLIDQDKAQGDVRANLPTPIIVQALQALYRADYEALLQPGGVSLDDVSEHLISVVMDGIRTQGATS